MTLDFLGLGAFGTFWIVGAIVIEARGRGVRLSVARLIATGAVAGAGVPAMSTCYLLMVPEASIPIGFWRAALIGSVGGGCLCVAYAAIRRIRHGARTDHPLH